MRERSGGSATPSDGARRDPPGWLVWAALWTVYLVWGSTYLAIRVMVETLPPLLSAGARFLFAGAIMFTALLALRGRRILTVGAREIGASALIGGLLLVGGNGLLTVAERRVPSGVAALVLSSIPLWVVLLRSVSGDRVERATLVGVAVGFVGVAVLVLPGELANPISGASLVLLVASPFLWSLGSFLSGRLPLPKDPFVSTGTQMLAAGPMLLAAGWIGGEVSALEVGKLSIHSVAALAYLVFAGSLLAFTAFVWLLQNAPLSKVATYAYVNPVVAIVLGWAILSEEITGRIVAGAVVVVASVAYIVRKESTPRTRPEAGTPSAQGGTPVEEPS